MKKKYALLLALVVVLVACTACLDDPLDYDGYQTQSCDFELIYDGLLVTQGGVALNDRISKTGKDVCSEWQGEKFCVGELVSYDARPVPCAGRVAFIAKLTRRNPQVDVLLLTDPDFENFEILARTDGEIEPVFAQGDVLFYRVDGVQCAYRVTDGETRVLDRLLELSEDGRLISCTASEESRLCTVTFLDYDFDADLLTEAASHTVEHKGNGRMRWFSQFAVSGEVVTFYGGGGFVGGISIEVEAPYLIFRQEPHEVYTCYRARDGWLEYVLHSDLSVLCVDEDYLILLEGDGVTVCSVGTGERRHLPVSFFVDRHPLIRDMVNRRSWCSAEFMGAELTDGKLFFAFGERYMMGGAEPLFFCLDLESDGIVYLGRGQKSELNDPYFQVIERNIASV